MRVIGTSGMTPEAIRLEIDRGARFVQFDWVYSLLFVTIRQPSDIYFIRGGENSLPRQVKYTLATLLLGWWGIPWGPIYSIRALIANIAGGRTVPIESIDTLTYKDVSTSSPTLHASLAEAKAIARVHKRVLMGFWLSLFAFIPVIGQLLIPVFAVFQAWFGWQATSLLKMRYRPLACLLCILPVINVFWQAWLANRVRSDLHALGVKAPFAGIDPADLDSMSLGPHPAAGLTSH